MSCYTPLFRVEDLSKFERAADGHLYHPAKIIGSKQLEKHKDLFTGYNKWQLINCGKCIGCRLDYSRDKANLGYLEMLTNKKNTCWFITLTYDDDNLKINNEIELNGITYTETEENPWNGTLEKEEATKFIKRLREYMERKYNNKGIKYMICGEYGGKTKRPHYHAILFGCELPIESFYAPRIKNNEVYYQNKIIEKLWTKGISNITECSWQTIAYVGRYITKKIIGNESEIEYALRGQQKEFLHVSKNPPIGYKYYLEHKLEIYDQDRIPILHKGKTVYVKPPKLYDKYFEKEHPEKFNTIKKKRQREQMKQLKIKAMKTDHDEWAQLQIERRTKEAKTSTLKREL